MVSDEPRRKYAKLDNLVPVEEMRITPILHISLTREEIPLVEFYVIHFINKKNISNFLRDLPVIPDKFSFLKRVDREGRILIQPLSDPIHADLLHVLSLYSLTANDLQVVRVPESKPYTRKQFNWSKVYWPTAFHPNKDVEILLNGMYFYREFKQKVFEWSIRAIETGCIVVQTLAFILSVISMPPFSSVIFQALVHCRAARVFFVCKSRNGVLCPGRIFGFFASFHRSGQANPLMVSDQPYPRIRNCATLFIVLDMLKQQVVTLMYFLNS
uniref:AHD domain-containing protein n=1 Tax=Heterorhabditis bacteriophora TaxID=37862 RepID=A0A1I7X741_HETBA